MPDSSGGGGGGGGGYNIPVSLSDARSQAFANQFQAGTTFNFSSPFSGTQYAEQGADPILPSTATSAAAEGDAMASTEGSGVALARSPEAPAMDWKIVAIVAGAAVAAVALLVYLKR